MTVTVDAPTVVALGRGRPVCDGELGGKGASLDRLLRAGFPVPSTAVITASTYRRVLADPALDALVARIDSGCGDLSADEVDAAFLAAPIPPSLAETIVAAAREVGAGHPVAIRSSATVEDLAGASFAGQYRSSLNVLGDDAVLRAVRLTWASLWHPAPCAYRRAWGIASQGIAMPVVIMRMVPARVAGVAFTADPGGARGVVRVEAVSGLGEALVSGARTPDVWLLERDRPDPHPPAPAHIRAVAELAVRVEHACGTPQDVEWAWDGARLWLVQARPITATRTEPGDGCETAVDDSELTTAGIGEMLPGVLPPLVWDVNSLLVEEALRGVLGQLHALPGNRHGPHEFIRRVNGQAALDLGLLKIAAGTLPGGSEAELERQYFGVATPDAEVAEPAGRWRTLRHHIRAAAARRHSTVEAEVILAATGELTANRPALDGWTERELQAYRRRLIDFGARAMTVELAVAAAAVAAYRELELTLAKHLDDGEAATVAQRLTSGAGSARAPEPAMSRSVFAGPTWAETGTDKPARPGRRGPDDDDEARHALERRLRSNPKWLRTRLLTGQVVDVRMHLLRRLIGDATQGLVRREGVKAAVLTVGGEVRRVHVELGRRLVAKGLLDQVDDVDLLRDSELSDALDGHTPPPAELTRRRRWIRRWRDEPPLPVRFTGVPDQPAVATPEGDRLQGWAASPGRHTARARVVTDPLSDRFDQDEVLVAAATDAGWSPLFVRAGAIVVERGGPLSHAAIVARELGVPAVLNVAGATQALNGRLVTVDGDTGVVTVHPSDEDA